MLWRFDAADSTGTISALNNIMAALFQSGRLAQAEAYAREAIPVFAAKYGDGHPREIMARNNLARVLLDLGRDDEALEILEKAAAAASGGLPPDSDVRQAVATNLIDARLGVGRASEAEALAHELLTDRREAGVPTGSVAQTLEQLGLCLLAQGRAAEAEAAFRECRSIRRGIDADHWLTHRAAGYVGAALAERGRFGEAEALLVESAEAIESGQASIAGNMRAREVAAAAGRVAEMYRQWGRPDDARAWAVRAPEPEPKPDAGVGAQASGGGK